MDLSEKLVNLSVNIVSVFIDPISFDFPKFRLKILKVLLKPSHQVYDIRAKVYNVMKFVFTVDAAYFTDILLTTLSTELCQRESMKIANF